MVPFWDLAPLWEFYRKLLKIDMFLRKSGLLVGIRAPINLNRGLASTLLIEESVKTKRLGANGKLGTNELIRSLLIFGYIIAVLLFSGLARADESKPLPVTGAFTSEY